jgi:hypothetical protein
MGCGCKDEGSKPNSDHWRFTSSSIWMTVYIATNAEEDDAGAAWMAGISAQRASELGDERQDIYTLADGEPIDPA